MLTELLLVVNKTIQVFCVLWQRITLITVVFLSPIQQKKKHIQSAFTT